MISVKNRIACIGIKGMLDNNKIVDNLDFIKIYFRIFIYKIIVAENTWIIQKRVKNLRIRIENTSKCKSQLKKT